MKRKINRGKLFPKIKICIRIDEYYIELAY